jgi:hypothetical protein
MDGERDRERAHKKQWRCHKCKQARKSKAKQSKKHSRFAMAKSLKSTNRKFYAFPRLSPPPPQSLLVSFVLKKKSNPKKEKKKKKRLYSIPVRSISLLDPCCPWSAQSYWSIVEKTGAF